MEQAQINLFGETVVSPKLIERDTLTEVFLQSMKNIDCHSLVAMLYSRFQAIVDFAELCNGGDTGQKISMLFNPHRYDTKTNKAPSLIESFKNDAFLSGLARATLFKHGKVADLLYQVLQLGINGAQYVNEFPPYTAQQIYMQYAAKKILDPCAGWGGRMIGAASVGAFYHGFEPATKTYNGLLELGLFLKSFRNGFDFNIECVPFEDANNISNDYDISFTSPPYYNTEIYSDEPNNSCNRYSTFTEWCEGFYLPMVKKSCASAKVSVFNLGCRQYPLVSTLKDAGFKVIDTGERLSGLGGLGKTAEGAESFYKVELSI